MSVQAGKTETVEEMITDLLSLTSYKHRVAPTMNTAFDYSDVLEDNEYEEPINPRHYM